MKIKTDFVTNSSSSSYRLSCKKKDLKGLEEYLEKAHVGNVQSFETLEEYENEQDEASDEIIEEFKNDMAIVAIVDYVIESWAHRINNAPNSYVVDTESY